MSDRRVAVLWFRRDLRLADNPALLAAVDDHDAVLALFVHDPILRRAAGAPRLGFLAGALAALAGDLGGALVQREGDPAEVVAATAREVGADIVVCAEDFGPHGRRRDRAVAAALATAGRRLEVVGSPYAVPPGTVLTGAGTPFKVFTPFANAWRSHGWDDPQLAPRAAPWLTGVRSDPRPVVVDAGVTLPPPGEAAGRARLDQFLADDAAHYAEQRDQPALDATSRLSPYLKWGCIHPRQVLARLGRSSSHRTFATELCWREFYADVLYHRPGSARTALVEKMSRLAVDTGPVADARFEAWRLGRTGYPIVDAGMRQLQAEGWMHNRVRMIAASFLVKDLHVDRRRGAAWFLDRLVDGDLASNNHGWQWVAGTGTDAAPYFRIFNPTAQGRRFDPTGDYVRRWVPELGALAGAAVHEPWARADLFGGVAGYPAPIVDHAVERAEALARYHGL